MALLSTATITPARSVRGTVRVPGDKSISHRYALLAALADGPSRLLNFAPGNDCRSTVACLRQLGVDIVEDGMSALLVRGRGSPLDAPSAALDAGNSGSTMRMLAGILAAQPFESCLVGDASLTRRPMRRVVDPLTLMGAKIDATDGHAPLTIHGGPLHAITHRPNVPSAQVKSAVLLAGLYAEGRTSVTEPAQTRDHTERALRAFGFAVETDGLTVSVSGGHRPAGQSLAIPGDFSSAAFWMVAAAALPGSEIQITEVGLNPTRIALIDVLQRFGARVHMHETGREAGEPRGTVSVQFDRTQHVEISPEEVPSVIDEIPAIAALAACGGEVVVRGAAELRVKESDRISALVAGFRGLGIDADERADGFVIHGGGTPSGGVADAHGDHRMAMAFAIAALAARGPSRVEGADAVAVSYPAFFETLERLVT